MKAFRARAALKAAIRRFFENKGYLEVDTPIAIKCPGNEIHLEYFKTNWVDHYRKEHLFFLRSSPEVHMKKTLGVTGEEKIFQMAPCFRNGGEWSEWHHPEFTMLEWYEAHLSFSGMVEQTKDLVAFCAQYLRDAGFPVQPNLMEKHNYTHFTLEEAFQEFVGVKLLDQDPDLARKAKELGVYSLFGTEDFETAFFKIILEKIEPEFKKISKVVLSDYPPSQAALAKVEEGVAKRFEFYLNAIELCNGYLELTDFAENQKRFQEANLLRRKMKKDEVFEDEGFYEVLRQGLPPTAGNALGFERLLALLLGFPSIHPFIPFSKDLTSF